MIYYKSIDVEDEIRKAFMLAGITSYCQPLPAEYDLPHIEIHNAGGVSSQTIDTFLVALDGRGDSAANVIDYMNDAIGRLKAVAKMQTTELRHVVENAKPVAVPDSVRPDLFMYRATIEVTLHQAKMEV